MSEVVMDCQEALSELDDYIDGYLAATEHSHVDNHLKSCSACRSELARQRELKAELRGLPAFDFSPSTARAAISRAKMAQPASRRPWFLASLGSALAAGLLIALVTILMAPAANDPDGLPMVSMHLDEVRQVNLVFDAPRLLGDVQFVVFLPENAELEGFPGQRRVEWQANLGAGANLLPLPVLARGLVHGELVARLTHNGESKEFKVRIETGRDERALAPLFGLRYRT